MTGRDRGAMAEWGRWAISGAMVLAAHVGAAGALTTWTEPLPEGAPQSAILLELAPVSASPPAEKSDVALDVRDQRADFTPVPEPVEKVEKEDLEPPKDVAVKDPEPVPEPPPPEPPRQKPAEVALPPPPRPPHKQVHKKKLAAINTRRVSSDVAADHVTAASPGAGGVARASYAQQIVAHLNRHKNYPASARARQEEGTVVLSFTLDRHGRVLGSRIARGSGHAELDHEALDMLKRAQPFPLPPPELAQQQFPMSAPIRYNFK